MRESMITEKLETLRSSVSKSEYIRIVSDLGKSLFNNHSTESFEIICNSLDGLILNAK